MLRDVVLRSASGGGTCWHLDACGDGAAGRAIAASRVRASCILLANRLGAGPAPVPTGIPFERLPNELTAAGNPEPAVSQEWWVKERRAAFGSATWEFFGETNKPSLNDFINTTLGGIAFGEMFHRTGESCGGHYYAH
jgi:hypothetical protein